MNSEKNSQDPSYWFESGLFCSNLPTGHDENEKKLYIMGIDEAGRGPVLGPMVYGAAYWTLENDELIMDSKFRDSKVLNEVQRERLFHRIQDDGRIGYVLRVIGSKEISEKMLRKCPISLNVISQNAAIEMIRSILSKGLTLSHIYVDTVGPPESYRACLLKEFPEIHITVAKKADSLYHIVSAASILAKVTRDRILSNWEFPEIGITDKNYGSGYPSDTAVVDWLRKNADPVFGFPGIVRFSWSTARNIISDASVEVRWNEVPEVNQSGIRTLTAFVQKCETPGRTRFFWKRNMQRVNKL